MQKAEEPESDPRMLVTHQLKNLPLCHIIQQTQ